MKQAPAAFNPLVDLGVPLLGTLFLWRTDATPVGANDAVCAFLLALVPWFTYRRWRRRRRTRAPILACVTAMYWMYFAVPLFWGTHRLETGFSPTVYLPSDQISRAMLLATVGVLALVVGASLGLGRRLAPALHLGLREDRGGVSYFRVILVGSILVSLSGSLYFFGVGGRNVIAIAGTYLPLVALALAFARLLEGRAEPSDRLLFAVCVVIEMFVGISSGWLGSLAHLVIVLGAVYLAERRRVPKLAAVLLIAYIAFFQVGKNAFRTQYWVEGVQGSRVERIRFWFDTSLQKWGDAIDDPSGGALRDLAFSVVSRVSLLEQTANVMMMTPQIVPFQGMKMYSYLAATLVPRAVWPTKPSVNEANRFYQVAYGLTAPERLKDVSIAVGFMTEGFISAGWAGVVVVMMLMGVILDFLEAAFLRGSSGAFLAAVGFAMIPSLITVESQMAQYLGGLVQEIVLVVVLFSPIILKSVRGRNRQAGYAPGTHPAGAA